MGDGWEGEEAAMMFPFVCVCVLGLDPMAVSNWSGNLLVFSVLERVGDPSPRAAGDSCLQEGGDAQT